MPERIGFSNPAGLYDPRVNGYSHLAEIPAGWRLVLPAGQGGETTDGSLSSDFREQLRQALRNLATALSAARASFDDVAKLTVLVVDHDATKLQVVAEEVGPVWPHDKPSMTLIPVPRLALPGMLVEIDAVAAVPADR